MKILKILISVLFCIVTIIFGLFFIKEKFMTDNSIPEINFENEELYIKSDSDKSVLLGDVTAFDEKDGDITDKVVIESISKFREKGTCNITYLVCDGDNHIVTKTRKIVYTDYTSPEFYMKRSLCFSTNDNVNIKGIIGAKDCIDGDISNNIVITSDDFENGIAKKYSIKVQVTNSKGDSISEVLPLYIENTEVNAPKIALKKYLIYAEQGDKIDFSSYVSSVTDCNNKNIKSSVQIESEYNYKTSKDGVYCVHYYATDSAGRKSHSVLLVIVGGK